MKIIDCEQRTEPWFLARAGRLTGSRAADMLAKIRSGGEAAARRDLRVQLAIEMLTGKPLDGDGYCSKEMQRGIDLEPTALAAYEALTGNVVRKTGFVIHDEFPIGCSVDGAIDGLAGLLELKCPKSATHVGYLKSGVLPAEYVAQVTHNLWVTGAQWCDFVSFDDRLPEALQMFVFRAERSKLDLHNYAGAALAFLAEVRQELDGLTALLQKKAA